MTEQVFEIIDGNYNNGLLLLADHASNYIPPEYHSLGLTKLQLERHIAFDPGVREFTIRLAEKLGVPAVLSKFSRLLIDPNRGKNDPTLVMRVADGDIIAGNRNIDEQGKQDRIERFYRPYDDAITNMRGKISETGVAPILFSIHSFTPFWRGNKRLTEVGILWDEDDRFTNMLIEALQGETNYIIHDNQPYKGGYVGDTMNRHGLRFKLQHSLLELRQDYVSTDSGINEWVDIFASILPKIVKNCR